MEHFVGTKKQMKIKYKTETVIKIISSPIWIPFWLLTVISYYIVYVIEYYADPAFEFVIDKTSSYIAKKLSK